LEGMVHSTSLGECLESDRSETVGNLRDPTCNDQDGDTHSTPSPSLGRRRRRIRDPLETTLFLSEDEQPGSLDVRQTRYMSEMRTTVDWLECARSLTEHEGGWNIFGGTLALTLPSW